MVHAMSIHGTEMSAVERLSLGALAGAATRHVLISLRAQAPHTHTQASRKKLVNHLIRLEGRGRKRRQNCFNLEEFAEILFNVHHDGMERYLNEHFRPQRLVCFLERNISQWDLIGAISDPRFTAQVATHLGNAPC